MHRFGMTGAGRWFGIEVGSRVDPFLLRVTGGRFATTSFFPLVLMSVKGRKSGELRTVPLVYFTEGDEVILTASSFGRAKHPAWYLNAVAAGRVELRAKGTGRQVRRPRDGGRRARPTFWAGEEPLRWIRVVRGAGHPADDPRPGPAT